MDQDIIRDGVVLFSLINEIGLEGQNSKVFRAHDRLMDQELVIKAIYVEKGDKDHEKVMADFSEVLKEAQFLSLCKHTNIAEIQYASFKEEESGFVVFIAMPFYKKGSLSGLLRDRNLTSREILKYAFEFLSGVSYIHSKNLVHGDIKPNNILLSDNNEALIADFGLTFLLDENGWGVLPSAYVLHLPPELINEEQVGEINRIPVNVQYDVWQIGMTLFRMCIGDSDFCDIRKILEKLSHSDQIALIKQGLHKIKPFPLHIPNKLQSVIKKCLHDDIDKRYKTVREILNDLSSIQDTHLLDFEYINLQEKKYVLKKSPNTYSVVEEDECYNLKKTTAKTSPKPKVVKNRVQAVSFLENLK